MGKAAFKKDLTNILALSQALGNPHKKFKSVHIAGTNGKGSCSHMIAAVCQMNGLKTGLYTSPHLVDFRERIRINGECISKKEVIRFVADNSKLIDEIQPSFFEITVAMAFSHFAKSNVDIAVIETGLGGRLDSTNIITPILSVITNIGFDHVEMLGDTLEKIAFEKAGIIKQNIPVLIGEKQKETTQVFESKASEKNAKLYFAQEIVNANPKTYREINKRTSLAALQILNKKNHFINLEGVEAVLENAHEITGLLGRWQILQESPKVILDTGHNVDGLKNTMVQLARENFNQLHIIWGNVNDKNLSEIFSLLPNTASYYWCEAAIPRAMPQKQVKETAAEFGLKGDIFGTPINAYMEALKIAKPRDLIFVGGSTFVVGDLLKSLKISTCPSSTDEFLFD